MAGLTLGLLGCGDIGAHVIKAAKAMGLKTAAFKRDVSAPGEVAQGARLPYPSPHALSPYPSFSLSLLPPLSLSLDALSSRERPVPRSGWSGLAEL